MNANMLIDTICKPLLLFLIFESALITYHITQLQFRQAGINAILTFFGSVLIYFLCKGGFELAAWLLLSIIPFFFVALIAFLVISQFINTNINNTYQSNENDFDSCTECHE
jgi:hypothetical protein